MALARMIWRLGALALVPMAVAGCNNKAAQAQLDELTAVSAQKDSLMQEMVANTKMMSQISTELAKVQGVVLAQESPSESLVLNRDTIVSRIHDLATRVTETEERLAASEKRVRRLSSQSDSLRKVASQFESTLADFKTIVETQKTTIAQLNSRVEALRQENQSLATEVVALVDTVLALEDTVTAMQTRENMVYYVVGTKDELKDQGVVVEEGSKFLFFGKKALVPARSMPDSVFVAIDKMAQREIPLPDPEKEYKIVSRQAMAYVGNEASHDGKFRGENLEIASPTQFWGPSRYLIIVQQ